MNLWPLVAVVAALLFGVPARAVSSPQQSENKILGFKPEPPVASKTEDPQLPAAVPAPSRIGQDSTGDRPPPTNARIIISILALVISTIVMYLWAKGLRKPKAKPVASPGHGAAPCAAPRTQTVAGRHVVLRMAMAAAWIATLFPPFFFQGAGGSRFGLGHSFILLPPRSGVDSAYFGSIDGLALLAILAGIALVAWISDRITRGD